MLSIFEAMGIAYTILGTAVFTVGLFWLAYRGIKGLTHVNLHYKGAQLFPGEELFTGKFGKEFKDGRL